MPFSAEVHPFKAEVGGEQDLEAGRTLQNRRIIPDAGANAPRAARGFGSVSNTADQRFFGQGQGEYTLPLEAVVRPIISHPRPKSVTKLRKLTD